MDGEEIVRRARAHVGARFRAQGRSGEAGLDCVGLVAAALGETQAPRDYRMRGGSAEELARGLARAGLRPVADPQPGDIVVMRPGAEQLHLGVWTGSGLVHADAGLGRVVERPGQPPWPILGNWRREI